MQLDNVRFDREKIANHATNLARTIQGNLKRSLESMGVVSARLARTQARLWRRGDERR